MHTSRNIQGHAVHLAPNKKRRCLAGLLLAAAFALCSKPTQASVVEFTGGPTTTQTDSEVYFSPVTGQVWTSFSDSALFAVANVSGNLAIAFNTTPDGTLVVAPNSVDPTLATIARLSSGAVVGASSLFDNTEYTLAESDGLIGNWNALGSGYFGFRFGTGTDVHYGWANITVLPDFNITLNSFAYETAAGQPITIATAAVPEPSSFALVGVFGVLGVVFLLRRRFSRRTQWASLAAGLMVGSTVLSAQTSTTTLPGQTDPVGNRLTQFRSDHLFSIIENPSSSSSNTVMNTFGVQYTASPFDFSLSTTSTTSTSTVSGRQYHAVSGHIIQPNHEDVAIAYVDGPNITVQIVGQPAANVTLPTAILPRYNATLPNGSSQPTVDFIAMAAGDLDQALDESGNYHDEVVIAYVTAQNAFNVVVLDYSQNAVNPQTGTVTVQQPNVVEFQALDGLQFNPAMMINGKTGQSSPGQVLPYDNIVSVSVGNFDGNGAAEIAVAAINYGPAQNPDTTLSVQTLRYRPEVSTIFETGVTSLSPPLIQEGSNSQQPAFLGASLTMTSGDYEGINADDVAFGYVAYGPALQSNEAQEIHPSSVIHLLKAPPQTQSIQVYLQPTGPNGSPTQLILSGIPAGSIPQQLTISNATANCNNSPSCPPSWSVLNGTWYTTLTSVPSNGGQIEISIPVNTTGLQQSSGQITVSLDTPLGQAPGNTPLQIQANPVSSSNPNDYPKLQLVSGLFEYDPTNGWSLSRRQLAAVYNNPPCQSTSCSSKNYSIEAAWYFVSPDQQNNPQFNLGGSNATQFQESQGGQHQVSATAGAFRGNTILQTPPTPDLSPVWSLAISSWIGSTNAADFISILEPNGNGGFNSNSQLFTTEAADAQARLAVVNYDSDGSSVYLGAPIHLTMSNLVTPTAIIKEPPKHLAWFQDLSNCPTTSPASSGPGICDLNRSATFNVQLQTSSSEKATTTSQETNGSDFSQSNSVSASASVDITVFPGVSNQLSASDTQSLSYSKSQTNSTYYSNSGSVTYGAGGTAETDDLIEAQVQNLDVWRYRVYSASGNASSPPTFYDLTYPSLPTNTTPNITAAGQSNDWYNPVHENGNVLSYSPLPPTQLPNDYSTSPYTVNGSTSGITNGVLYQGQGFCYGGVSGQQTIKMTGVSTQTDTVETDKTNSWDQDMKVGDTVKVEGSELSASTDADLGQNQSLSQSTASKNKTSGSTGVTFNVDAGNPEQGYNIFPIFYNSNTGVLKFVYYVSIPTGGSSGTCSEGGTWWTDNYGGAPDPALNLPFRFNSSVNQTLNTVTWSLNQDITREQLRSFFLTSNTENTVESTSSDNPVYTPLATNPAEGSTVRMAVRVYNFSLNPQNAENVTVQFSAMPYDGQLDNELGCGTPSSGETGRYCAPNTRTVLGTTTLASIPYWGSSSGSNYVLAALPWTIPMGFISSHENATEFRIYVNLIYSGSELNPPQAPCNNSSASNPAPCPSQIGATSSDPNWDPNAPGQNNEGWSYITLQQSSSQNAPMSSELTLRSAKAASNLSAALNGAPLHPTSAHNLKTVPDSLAAVDPAGHLKADLVVAYLGRRLHVRVKGQSEMNDVQELQKALVYDGSGRGKKVIAVKALRGVSTKGTSAWFHWTPTTPGLHQLTAELLEPLDDATKGDNRAKLSVIVVRAPGDVNGDGAVDGLDTAIIMDQMGKSTAESPCGKACDLNGDGFIGRADLNLAMEHCDNTSCVISHTIPREKRRKQNQ